MASAPPRLDRCILLVGPMGAGKTSVGRRLAGRLGLPFADSDEEIERASGITVSEIFRRFGESEFRERERRTISELIEGEPKVVAGGGGAFVDPRTRAVALRRCIVVWLDAPPEVLAARLSGQDRPLLNGQEPLEALRSLAAVRTPIYAEAPIRVRADLQVDEIVERIVEALR